METSNQEPPKEEPFQLGGCMFVVAGISGMIALVTGLSASMNTQGWGDVGSWIIFQIAMPVAVISLLIGLISRGIRPDKK